MLGHATFFITIKGINRVWEDIAPWRLGMPSGLQVCAGGLRPGQGVWLNGQSFTQFLGCEQLCQADVVALWKIISTVNNDNFVSFYSYTFNFFLH